MSKEFQDRIRQHHIKLMEEGRELYNQKKEFSTIDQESTIKQMQIEELNKFRKH